MASHLDYIFIDKNHSYLRFKLNTLYGNSDHQLVKYTLSLQQTLTDSSTWRFDKKVLNNKQLNQDLVKELNEADSDKNWDYTKICIQSIIRAYKKPKAPEKNISKLNRKITDLNKSLASNFENSNIRLQIDNLNLQLQDELTDMAEKWQICSKTKWIEQGEKSTKYFFAKYKARKAKSALEIIKDPNKLV